MGFKFKYLFFNYEDNKGWYIRFPIPKVAAAASILPLFGFVFCILWSLMYNFRETTFTHCKVSWKLFGHFLCIFNLSLIYSRLNFYTRFRRKDIN